MLLRHSGNGHPLMQPKIRYSIKKAGGKAIAPKAASNNAKAALLQLVPEFLVKHAYIIADKDKNKGKEKGKAKIKQEAEADIKERAHLTEGTTIAPTNLQIEITNLYSRLPMTDYVGIVINLDTPKGIAMNW